MFRQYAFSHVLRKWQRPHDRQLLFKANEKLIVKLQARARGALARKKYTDKVNYLHSHEPAIVKLQVLFMKKILPKRLIELYLSYVKPRPPFMLLASS